jgi:O-antigen/teichoic acid export membrane protein
MFGGLSFTIFSNIDAIMIKEMMGEAAVGTYAAAYRLTVVWHFLPGLLLSSLMPALVQSKNEPQRYQQRKQMVTSILIWFAIGLALFTSLTAGTIIKLTYGNAYSESASLLTLLMWVNVIIFFNSCWNHFSIINNNSRSVFYFHLSTATANIALNIILIPIYGLRGAAYAILASLAFSLTIFSVIDKTTLPLILSSLTLGRLNFDK